MITNVGCVWFAKAHFLSTNGHELMRIVGREVEGVFMEKIRAKRAIIHSCAFVDIRGQNTSKASHHTFVLIRGHSWKKNEQGEPSYIRVHS